MSIFNAGMCQTVWLGSTNLHSDLAWFLQVDTVPNTNHSKCVVGAFYVPPARVPVTTMISAGLMGLFQAGNIVKDHSHLSLHPWGSKFKGCFLCATPTGANHATLALETSTISLLKHTTSANVVQRVRFTFNQHRCQSHNTGIDHDCTWFHRSSQAWNMAKGLGHMPLPP